MVIAYQWHCRDLDYWSVEVVGTEWVPGEVRWSFLRRWAWAGLERIGHI